MLNTIDTYLMISIDSINYEKLLDIKTFPEIRVAPSLLDTTNTSQEWRSYIFGIIGETAGIEFNANYSRADYYYLKRLEGLPKFLSIWFGKDQYGDPDGHDGKFDIPGYLLVNKRAGNPNEVSEMGVFVAPSPGIVVQLYPPSISLSNSTLTITDHANNAGKTDVFKIYVDGSLVATVSKEE